MQFTFSQKSKNNRLKTQHVNSLISNLPQIFQEIRLYFLSSFPDNHLQYHHFLSQLYWRQPRSE